MARKDGNRTDKKDKKARKAERASDAYRAADAGAEMVEPLAPTPAQPTESRSMPLLKAEGPTDTVALELSWEGGDAVLASLTDNGDSVDFGRAQGVGEAGLKLRWTSPDAFLHVIQWDLWFQGTRTNLSATATVNGTGGFEDAVEADSKKDRWSASGTAEE